MEFKQFAIKSVSDEGTFSGWASIYGNVDSYGDIVTRGAFTKSLQKNRNRIKVLAQHSPDDVIGLATLTDKPDGLWADGKLVLDLESARDMHTRMKNGLIDG